MRRAVAAIALAWLTGCAVQPRDPFVAAERALIGNDLLEALLAYDAVPVSHLRYPEARAAAAGVERRMRRGHELLLEGLLLRSEWRDEEALTALQRARVIWPNLPGIDPLITATRNRSSLFGRPVASAPAPGAPSEPPVGPVLVVPEVPTPEPTVAESELDEARVVEAPAIAAPAVEAPQPALVGPEPRRTRSLTEDPIALGLVAVETKLWRGELEGAVGDLVELASRFPDDARVQVRLGRMLHQRALLRYGQGALSAAIADWQQVLLLEPGNALARSLLQAAQAEAAVATPAR